MFLLESLLLVAVPRGSRARTAGRYLGSPPIQHTVEAALEAWDLLRTVVSTEAKESAEISGPGLLHIDEVVAARG